MVRKYLHDCGIEFGPGFQSTSRFWHRDARRLQDAGALEPVVLAVPGWPRRVWAGKALKDCVVAPVSFAGVHRRYCSEMRLRAGELILVLNPGDEHDLSVFLVGGSADEVVEALVARLKERGDLYGVGL